MAFWQRIRELSWWAIGLSLAINVLALAAAIIAISVFREEKPYIVVSFLLLHIFVSQPLKDWLIMKVDLQAGYGSKSTFYTFENRLARIARVRDVLDFLSWLIRTWKLNRVRLLVFDEEDFVYFLTENKGARKMRIRDEFPQRYRAELAAFAGVRPVTMLTPELKAYMQSRKVKLLVPILFRDRLIGLLGFSEMLDKTRLPFVDHAAHRISLAIENEQLERTVPRSEFLKKEFRLAERIERHLSGPSFYRAGVYGIQKLDTAWNKKHFAAIFGCAPAGNGAGIERYFAMLLRLTIASTRSNALQLFAAQGYFYSLASDFEDVEQLALALHNGLRKHENRSIALEGFLVSIDASANAVRLMAFGSQLAYRTGEGWVWVRPTAALGSDGYQDVPVIDLGNPKEAILSVREYPLILISGNEP